MNISEFAEQIVFSNSLDDKLAPPGKLSFDRRRSSQLPSEKSLRTPGRPAHLQMLQQRGGNQQAPRADQLEDERTRGQLLHFLANHELLATELMALVLLKFPDAPRAFRQGVLVTLQEEQLHTRMYLERMQECGVEFGQWPVSGQFWRMVEPMQTPLDFVSRLSLTFEQANLDYSRHFAAVFEQIGDEKTAQLLNKIYEDEIGHVQHGLDWFRQWKDPQQSDFEAWSENLCLPMSPARARGPRAAFNREGRREAGLTDEFIDAVEVFGQSKDRSAALRWFDAAPEVELSGKRHPIVDQLQADLEFVSLALSKPDDVLLVRKRPSQELSKHWLDAGIELPEFCGFDEIETLAERKLNRCEPWARTGSAERTVLSIADSLRHPYEAWDPEHAKFYSKRWATDWMRGRIGDSVLPTWMAGAESLGVGVGPGNSLSAALAELSARGVATVCYKPDLSSSGRGMHRIETSRSSHRKGRENEPAVVEPYLDRVVDVSFLWHVSSSGEARFLGWTRAITSEGGRYEGTVLGQPFFHCDAEVRKFLLADRCAKLGESVSWLESTLVAELVGSGFVGNLGVDAMLYRDEAKQLKLRPFVELNPRSTMGHVALALQKRVAAAAKAEFRLLTQSQYQQRAKEFSDRPIELSANGRWSSGVVWFSERRADTRLIPCVIVGD